MTSPDTPHSLLEGLLDHGDAASWGRFVTLYEPLIRNWARPLIADGAIDDVVQEVLTTLLEALPDFRHNRRPGAFRSWLKTVTHHRIRRHWDRRARFEHVLEDLEDPEGGLSKAWDSEHDHHVLNLPLTLVRPEFEPATWLAFTRTVIDDRPALAVAEELGVFVNSVYIAQARALKRLRREGRGLIEIP